MASNDKATRRYCKRMFIGCYLREKCPVAGTLDWNPQTRCRVDEWGERRCKSARWNEFFVDDKRAGPILKLPLDYGADALPRQSAQAGPDARHRYGLDAHLVGALAHMGQSSFNGLVGRPRTPVTFL